MPIITQRGIYEKVNSVTEASSGGFKMVVKEIQPDLTVVGTTPVEGVVVNRKSESSADKRAFVLTELSRIKRLSQGKVKMIETGTGDTETVTAFIKKEKYDDYQMSENISKFMKEVCNLIPFPLAIYPNPF